MTRLIHIVGPQGSGKSTLATALVRGMRLKCAIVDVDEALYLTNDDARCLDHGSNENVIVIAEELGERHRDLRSGDLLITLSGSAS